MHHFPVHKQALRLLCLWLLLAGASSAGEMIQLSGPFIPFGFGINNLSPAEQVALCKQLGYDGLCLTGTNSSKFAKFADLPDVAAGKFHIPCALWWAKAASPPDDAVLAGVVTQAARMGTALWMVAEGKKTPENVEAAVRLFRTTAEHCLAKKVQLVLYPHQGCTFETAEEALALWKRLDHPEVRISIHLCHELKAGNRDRLDAIIDQVAPLLALVSISGAEADTQHISGWASGIMPLDRGSYDPRPFLRALARNGYAGPVILHTYGITDPPAEHFARSLARWREWVAAPSQIQAPPR